MTEKNVRLRKERFLQWLKAQKPSSLVGSTREFEKSPIANYAIQRLNVKSLKRPLQKSGWVAEFLTAVSQRKSNNITARTAVKLLS